MNDEVWFCIRQTPSVTGFVGQVQKNQRPPALTRREEKEFLLAAQETTKKTRIIAEEWLEGEAVRITDGPFKDFTGVVQENDPAQNKLKVLVNIFGRETLVEMGADQVTR
jgi:transcriptional antiterminator NusG